ncbi:MAG: GIY-YIG nuclease family protein [Candidatus Kerfeldbacteria bacterium]|nr:GIY-YIG nuclease family protein [Candidatus Kerfeldbacteria bacterium]
MKCWVYILASDNCRRFYIGSSVDVRRRLDKHNNGKVMATRNKGPWRCVFQQEYGEVRLARRAEMWLKKMKSRKIIEQIIRNGIVHRIT